MWVGRTHNLAKAADGLELVHLNALRRHGAAKESLHMTCTDLGGCPMVSLAKQFNCHCWQAIQANESPVWN